MQPDGAASLSEGVDYKKKYKTLKRKLRMLIYEQECFAEELRKAQRKLLRISRDKSFLLDRLLQYEQCDQSATDTDSTADSESDHEQPPTKRKKQMSSLGGASEAPPPPSLLASMVTQRMPTPKSFTATLPSQSASQSPADSNTKSKSKVSKKTVKQGVKTASVPQYQSGASSKPSPVLNVTSPTRLLARSLQGQGSVKLGQPAMSREELERHLDQKQSNKSAFMNIEKTPLLPENIFNENSNS